eukprot:jgi/Galph1/790/GphlegSOOS_G5470.1
MQTSQISILKRELRKRIKERLNSISEEQVSVESAQITKKLAELPQFQDAQTVGCFVSFAKEVNTFGILERIFQSGKRCYLPRIKANTILEFYEADSLQEILSWEPNQWGIREPPITKKKLILDKTSLDLIVVPGLAFDPYGRRLGRGKGYYDRFISTCKQATKDLGKKQPFLAGVALSVSMVDLIPTDVDDQPVDIVISPHSP